MMCFETSIRLPSEKWTPAGYCVQKDLSEALGLSFLLRISQQLFDFRSLSTLKADFYLFALTFVQSKLKWDFYGT